MSSGVGGGTVAHWGGFGGDKQDFSFRNVSERRNPSNLKNWSLVRLRSDNENVN